MAYAIIPICIVDKVKYPPGVTLDIQGTKQTGSFRIKNPRFNGAAVADSDGQRWRHSLCSLGSVDEHCFTCQPRHTHHVGRSQARRNPRWQKSKKKPGGWRKKKGR